MQTHPILNSATLEAKSPSQNSSVKDVLVSLSCLITILKNLLYLLRLKRSNLEIQDHNTSFQHRKVYILQSNTHLPQKRVKTWKPITDQSNNKSQQYITVDTRGVIQTPATQASMKQERAMNSTAIPWSSFTEDRVSLTRARSLSRPLLPSACYAG